MAWKEKSTSIFLHKHPYASNLEDRWQMESPSLEIDNTTDLLEKSHAESLIQTPNSDNRAFYTLLEPPCYKRQGLGLWPSWVTTMCNILFQSPPSLLTQMALYISHDKNSSPPRKLPTIEQVK